MAPTGKNVMLFFALSLVHTVQGLEATADECADMSNTTWQQYRQQRQQRAQPQVRYLLMTREHLGCARPFHQVPGSSFNATRPTKIVIHGYRALGSKPSWVLDLAEALLEVEDVNVLMVDWVHCASFAYNLVVDNYKEVALQISVLVNRLQKEGCKLETFHFIGISLGAHVAGFVGTLFEGKIGRITGLDPAGPMFKGADTFDRLDPSDAQFVDAIHTDSDYFGISIPVGHVDFFLNGGNDQTGCARSRFASVLGFIPVYGYVICDHMRALQVYMSALNASCWLSGVPCDTYQNFLQGRCLHCDVFRGTCPTIGLSENCGIRSSPLPTEQKLFLLTTSRPPFCAHHILLVLEASALTKSAEVEVTLTTGDLETRQRLRLQTDTTVYKAMLAHPAALCEIRSITLKNTGARFYRQNDVHLKSICLSQIASRTREEPLCVNNINVRRGSPWSHDFVQVCNHF
ncbi:phospholipase A1 member A isoform X2 [Hippocampus zosterae]|uniref:phospholipase A1 member A isoform X2 n=1 Tax=Hippocampus zosterae TaxID=109293 RepID=UPI00223CC724|nr:phospholipase A1 member A isoform X2 [Hippocampus zosterae]